MRKKAIIPGFNNSQKFRFILSTGDFEQDVGMYITIQQMSDQFATTNSRVAVWTAMERLASQRQLAEVRCEPLPLGLSTTVNGFQVQVSLAG